VDLVSHARPPAPAPTRSKAAPRIWDLPALPDFCGPKDLAEIVEKFRIWENIGAQGDADLAELHVRSRGRIAGKALRELFSLAYQASFLRDEGRSTRGRLFFPGAGVPQPRRIVPFVAPVELDDPNTLRLLGPALAADNYSLSLFEDKGRLFCDGVFLMNENEADVPIMGVSLRRSTGCLGLNVTILDPGELVITEGALRLKLRATKIVDEGVVPFAPRVGDWLHECTNRIYLRCCEQDPEGMEALHFAPLPEITVLLSMVLSTARNLKHGGCFVILDQPGSPFVDIKFPTQQTDLGDQIAQYWLACAKAMRLLDKKGFAEAAQEYNRLRHVVLATIRALGTLAATDGCVVLDRALRVHGFGGIIAIPPGTLAPARPLMDDRASGPNFADQLLARNGTRHKSAFQLCQYLGNTITFVISQDGGVRVFSSDQHHVYTMESLAVSW
jgi:hypothetical protein